MKVLAVHNFYQQLGGEDYAYWDEQWLLRSHGHEVVEYTVHNQAIAELSNLALASKVLWNRQAYQEVRTLIRRERPDVMHCTNVFPLISPSVYYAAQREGVPVIQSLHNYRLLCPSVTMVRDSATCEDCLGKLLAWPAIAHRCYRGSRMASAGVATMLGLHRLLRTWTRQVDAFITVSNFAREKLTQGGLPAERIFVKPNFVRPDEGPGDGSGGYAIFVGRLSPEKGIETLLSAWRQLPSDVPLRIVGDGPLAELVKEAVRHDSRIEWLGLQPTEVVHELLHDAACLIFPSVGYETFGRTIIEAYMHGVPVIASRLGAVAELVAHRSTGLLFDAGQAQQLASSVENLLADPMELSAMRQAARVEYEQRFTPDLNYEVLLDVYSRVLSRSPARSLRLSLAGVK